MSKELPYNNASPMYLVENVDDKDYLEKLVLNIVNGLLNSLKTIKTKK